MPTVRKKKKPELKSPLTGTGYHAATVRTLDALEDVVEAYKAFDTFVFDVETIGTREARGKKDIPPLDSMTNEVLWISIAGPGRCDVIPCGHPTGPEHLTQAQVFKALEPLFFSNRRKVNQNVKFDLLTIAKYYDGRVPPPPYGETSVLVFLLNENLRSYALGDLIGHYYGFHYRKVAREGKNIDEHPFNDIALYSYLDSKWTWLLWKEKFERIQQRPQLLDLFNLEMDVLDVLLKMQRRGALVDRNGFEQLDRELEPKLRVLEQKIYRAAGHKFLVTSTQQKAKLLYEELGLPCLEKTKTGAPSVAESALRPIANKHPVVKLLLEHTDLKKLHSTYVVGFQQHIHPDGRIRATFNQRGAKTGRFSSSSPNLQNLPRQAEEEVTSFKVRGLFIAPPGHVLVVGDYSQIELRLLAHYAGPLNPKSRLVYAYNNGIDLHTMTAMGLTGKPADKISREERTSGKTANFLLAFGGGPLRLVESGGYKITLAKEMYNGFHRTYPEIKRWSEIVITRCRGMGRDKAYVETLFGRKRRLPEICHPTHVEALKKLRAYAERQAVNHKIQGTAADINKMAMVRTQRRLDREGHTDWHLILTVHDELVLEVPEEDAEAAVTLLREAMEGVKVQLRVPLVADIHYATRWSDAK